jgi:hypothetical protein
MNRDLAIAADLLRETIWLIRVVPPDLPNRFEPIHRRSDK